MKEFFRCIKSIIILVFLLSSIPAMADDLTIYGGQSILNMNNSQGTTFSFSYRYDLSKYFSGSIEYLNEGHLEGHKRDGFVAQGWASVDVIKDKLSVGIGTGPYYYCDTQTDNIKHGTALITSGALTYNFTQRILMRVIVSRVMAIDNGDTDLFRVGIGYRF